MSKLDAASRIKHQPEDNKRKENDAGYQRVMSMGVILEDCETEKRIENYLQVCSPARTSGLKLARSRYH